MDTIKTNSYEMDYENNVSNPSIFNFKEVLSFYNSSEYHNFISSVLMQTNMKWLYPSLTIVIVLEIFTSYKYLTEAFKINFAIKYLFILAIFFQTGLGFIFLKYAKENKNSEKNKFVIYSTILNFIFFQSFFYLAGTFSNQSFFYFVSAIVAISLFPALHTKYVVFFGIINYSIFLSIMYYKYKELSMLSVSMNSLYIFLITLLLSFYFFTSKITSLINSKKISIFAKDMATANDTLNYLNESLEKLSLTDPLTKINNRRSYEIDSEKIWSHALRSKTPIAVLVIDIDFFKQYNDYFGHPQGDICIIKVAEAIRSCFKRKSDIVARIGGEEFVVVLSSVNLEQAKLMAQRTLNAVSELKMEHPKSTISKFVTISLGIVSITPTIELSMDKIFSFADKALYRAKKTGRNKFCWDNEKIENISAEEINLKLSIINREVKLETVLNNSAMCYFFIDFEKGNIEISSNSLEFFGLESKFLESLIEFYSFIYTEDIEKMDILINSFYDHNKEVKNLNLRILDKNDNTFWVRCSLKLIFESESKPSFIVGSFVDINEQMNSKTIIDNLIDGNYEVDLYSYKGKIEGNILNNIKTSNKDDKFNIENFLNAINFSNSIEFDNYIKKIKDDNFLIEKYFEFKINCLNKKQTWFFSKNNVLFDSFGKAKTLKGSLISLDNLENYNNFIVEKSLVNAVSGLPDKQILYKDLEQILNQNINGYLFLIDIDNFNNINNIFSYGAGNKFLKDLSFLIADKKLYEGKIYHFEGDLFVINFLEMDFNMAKNQLSIFKDISNKPIIINEISYQFSLSLVCIEYPRFGSSVDELLRNGDIALHKVKANGKNNSIFFSDFLYKENNQKLELEKDLRRCVNNNMEGFLIYFHPLLLANDNTCIGAESLIRWRSPDGEIVMPFIILPILEEAGLMNKVGEWVLKESTLQCKKWLQKGLLTGFNNNFYIDESFFISINISAHQLAEDYFEENLLNYLMEIELETKHIVLELTESALIMDIVKARSILNSLRRKGIKIAIDDFGTGYSSLSYFRELPVDEVKIDRSFIMDLEKDRFSREFVNSIIKITQSIDRLICVEGVETETQAEILKGLNANILQGFLYSVPIPKDEFEENFLKEKIF